MISVENLKNALLQLNNNDNVIFNLEILNEDGSVIESSKCLGIDQFEIVKSYEEGIVNDEDLEKKLNINLYHYINEDLLKNKK